MAEKTQAHGTSEASRWPFGSSHNEESGVCGSVAGLWDVEVRLFPLHWCLPGSHSVCVIRCLPALTPPLLFDLASEKTEMQKLHFWEETLCDLGLCNRVCWCTSSYRDLGDPVILIWFLNLKNSISDMQKCPPTSWALMGKCLKWYTWGCIVAYLIFLGHEPCRKEMWIILLKLVG